jgi:hypothetical protein
MVSDSAAIDAAIIAKLVNDPTLQTLAPDGVWFEVAKEGAATFIRVSLADQFDEPMYGGTAYETALYLIEFFDRNPSGDRAKQGAARIHELLQDQTLTAPGYTWMTVHREKRERHLDIDEIDKSIRWQRRGGYYRVDMSVGS